MAKILTGFVLIISSLILISFVCSEIPACKSEKYEYETNPPFEGWQLTVSGFVENPFNLTWPEFRALPRTTVVATLVCVDYPNNPMESGNWTGVQLRTLLEKACLKQNAVKVGFLAYDGYSTDLTVEEAMQENIIIAYENNGVYTNNLRLVVPGRWGYKWISQLIRIEILDYNFLGFWESKGYSDIAEITSSDVSQPTPNVNVSPSTPTSPPSISATPTPTPSPPTSQQPDTFSDSAKTTPTPTTEPKIQAENILSKETGYMTIALATFIILVAIPIIIRRRKRRIETENKTSLLSS